MICLVVVMADSAGYVNTGAAISYCGFNSGLQRQSFAICLSRFVIEVAEDAVVAGSAAVECVNIGLTS